MERRSRARPQEKPEDPGRREVLRRLGNAAIATLVAGSGGIGMLLKEPRSAQKPAKPKSSEGKREVPCMPERTYQAHERNSLDSYTFLDADPHPLSMRTGALVGERLSDLYALYLGIPSESIVPEVLRTDFKANLATLWRQKFRFDAPGRTPEEEHGYRERFLEKHKDLMDLAERLYCSYEPAHARTVSLSEFSAEVEGVVEKSHKAFINSMFALRDDPSFPRSRRFLVEKLGNRINADMLLACGLTELMPSADGQINALMLDFLLQHAGVEFLDRIPSVHNMLPSFGLYQITPAFLAAGGEGSFAEKVEGGLPAAFKKPKSVDDVQGAKQHEVAYLAAIEHIAQFVERLSDSDTSRARKLFDHTDLELLREEVTAFVAAAHHQPVAAYRMLDAFIKHTDAARPNPDAIKRLFEYIGNEGVQEYAHKALANYACLSAPGALASIQRAVS